MTSTTIYTPIKPTYLYIKQHSITGLKYFGKTTMEDPIKYLGSGKYWKNHIKKHGKQFVETTWVSDLYTDTSITEFALFISEEYDIVESEEWANLEAENGLDGGVQGRTPSDETKAKISASKKDKTHSAETKAKISASSKGKTHSAESIAKMSASKTGRTHSAETKAKISAASKGKTQSAEHIAKRAASNTGRKKGPLSAETKAKISAAKTGRKKDLSLLNT